MSKECADLAEFMYLAYSKHFVGLSMRTYKELSLIEKGAWLVAAQVAIDFNNTKL